MKPLKLIFSIIAIALIACFIFYYLTQKKINITTDKGIISYRIESAITPEQQKQGLMNRKYLPSKTGMIFLFKPIRFAHMWMKNTLIPLDMIFFDSNGYVVQVHYNAKPNDETIISSIVPVAGVLEINAGEAQKYHITQGSVIDLKSIQ